MSDNNLQKLNKYFEIYIDKMFIKDIELLKVRNDKLRFSYPYILLTCSSIDFFGGVEKGFAEQSGLRITWFVTEWMSKINPPYKRGDLACLIYDSWRCGVIHQATLKKGFEASSYKYPRDKHLYYIEDKKRVFIHSLQFADDFIEAQKLYREYINKRASDVFYIDSLWAHLSDMITEDKNEKNRGFSQFIKYLQVNNLFFKSTDYLPANRNTTTRLPDDIAPSAMAEEHDLE